MKNPFKHIVMQGTTANLPGAGGGGSSGHVVVNTMTGGATMASGGGWGGYGQAGSPGVSSSMAQKISWLYNIIVPGEEMQSSKWGVAVAPSIIPVVSVRVHIGDYTNVVKFYHANKRELFMKIRDMFTEIYMHPHDCSDVLLRIYRLVEVLRKDTDDVGLLHHPEVPTPMNEIEKIAAKQAIS